MALGLDNCNPNSCCCTLNFIMVFTTFLGSLVRHSFLVRARHTALADCCQAWLAAQLLEWWRVLLRHAAAYAYCNTVMRIMQFRILHGSVPKTARRLMLFIGGGGRNVINGICTGLRSGYRFIEEPNHISPPMAANTKSCIRSDTWHVHLLMRMLRMW